MKMLLYKIWAAYAVILFLLLMLVSLPVVAFTMILTPGPRALRPCGC